MKSLSATAAVCISLIGLSAMAHSQSKLSYEILGGGTYLDENRQSLANWQSGWTIGLGVAYEILPGFAVTANESYSNFLFNGVLIIGQPRLFLRNHNPELDKSVAISPLLIHGNNSQIYRTSFGIQTTSERNSIRPFLSLETGVSIIHLGKISYQPFFYDFGPPGVGGNYGPEQIYQEASTHLVGFGSIGVGIYFPMTNSVGMKIEGKWFDTWDNGDAYFPLTTTLSFQF